MIEIEGRECVLLDLAEKFLDPESVFEAKHCLAEKNFSLVELNILITLDQLFADKEINELIAKQAYEKLNLDPIRSSEIRQTNEQFSLFYYNQPKPLLN